LFLNAGLGLERVDLFLMHWPLPTLYDGDYVSTWKAMTELLADGRLRSAGVSNFQPGHLDRIIDATGVVPVVNQIEVHPEFSNSASVAASRRHGIAVDAWSPLGQGKVLENRGGTRQVSGADHSALAHPAPVNRVPEIHAPRADAGELQVVRFRTVGRRHCDSRCAR
jgi:diketogulonate reductase-like aldo/keto reductase